MTTIMYFHVVINDINVPLYFYILDDSVACQSCTSRIDGQHYGVEEQ